MIEPAAAAPPLEEDTETASIPVSLLDGQPVKPGDVVRLKVISVDAENGSVNVAYDHAPQPKPMPKDTEAMADEMNQPES